MTSEFSADFDLSNKVTAHFRSLFTRDSSLAITTLEQHIVNCANLVGELLSELDTDRDFARDSFGLDNESFKRVMIRLIDSSVHQDKIESV